MPLTVMRSVFAIFILFVTLQAYSVEPGVVADTLAEASGAQEKNQNDLPLYELGLGIGALYGADYPGASQSHLWILPVPFLVYRGDILRSDKKGGTRARWKLAEGLEFNLSAAGALPSSSGQDEARQGMPDLEWLGELGPAISIRVFRSKSGDTQLKFNIPVRGSVSTNFQHLTWRGFVFAPNFFFDTSLPVKNLDFFSLVSADFADRSRMDYYYQVAPQYATANRAAYNAKTGYLQTSTSVGLTYEIPKIDVSFFSILSYDSLAGATNNASPLVKSEKVWSGGLAVIWKFEKSKKLVHYDQQ